VGSFGGTSPRSTRSAKSRTSAAFAACQIAAAGDLLLTLPRSYALRMAALLPVAVQPLPLRLKPFPLLAYWHESRETDRAHQWVRERVASLVRGTAGVAV